MKEAVRVRGDLFRRDVPPTVREEVCGLVRHRLLPFTLVDRDDPVRAVLECAETARASHLALLAEAEARRRPGDERDRLLASVALFTDVCREQGCLDGPFAFPSDHTRFVYFRSRSRAPGVLAHDDSRCEVTLLSGLPASGKDTWIREHAGGQPVVSLDEIRDELDVAPTDEQGTVVQRARLLAREHLRAGRSFVWNAVGLTRAIRAQTIDLAASYSARVRIVAVETTWRSLLARNRARERHVPERVIERMLGRWEMPDRTEAHRVEWVTSA